MDVNVRKSKKRDQELSEYSKKKDSAAQHIIANVYQKKDGATLPCTALPSTILDITIYIQYSLFTTSPIPELYVQL